MVEWVERTTALIALRASPMVLAMPDMGRFVERDGLLLARAAPHQVFAMRAGVGVDLVAELAPVVGEAGLIDLSDARVGVRLAGPGTRARMGHLVPLDLDGLAVGGCAQTVMEHLSVLVLRMGDEVFEVQCGRSFAGSFGRAIGGVLEIDIGQA